MDRSKSDQRVLANEGSPGQIIATRTQAVFRFKLTAEAAMTSIAITPGLPKNTTFGFAAPRI